MLMIPQILVTSDRLYANDTLSFLFSSVLISAREKQVTLFLKLEIFMYI